MQLKKEEDYHFPLKDVTIKLIKHLIESGHKIMISDFAAKSLINDWSEEFGPNPFVNLGICTGKIDIHFNNDDLKNCPSPQLQMVGQLSDNGYAELKAMPYTIVFGTDYVKNDFYTLDILSVVTKAGGWHAEDVEDKYLNSVGGYRGAVGHVMLNFTSGAILFVSAGHWIELTHLDVKLENLEAASNDFGDEYKNDMKSIKNETNSEVKKTKIKKLAKRMVQSRPGC